MSADPDLIARAVSSLGPVLPEQPASSDRARSAASPAVWRWPAWLLGAFPPVAVLVLAEAAVRSGWIAPNLLPAPSDVIAALAQMIRDGQLAQHVLASTLRVAGGFALGAVLAVLFGALVGLSGVAAAVLTPSFHALRAIPSLAWVPLLLLWLGIDEASKVALIAIGASSPSTWACRPAFATWTASWWKSRACAGSAGWRSRVACCCPPRCRRCSPDYAMA